MKKFTKQNSHLFFQQDRCPARGEKFTWSTGFEVADIRQSARVAGCQICLLADGKSAELTSSPWSPAPKLPLIYHIMNFSRLGQWKFDFNSIRRPYGFGPGTVLHLGGVE